MAATSAQDSTPGEAPARIGVAGRRDYPANPRREAAGTPTAKPATSADPIRPVTSNSAVGDVVSPATAKAQPAKAAGAKAESAKPETIGEAVNRPKAVRPAALGESAGFGASAGLGASAGFGASAGVAASGGAGESAAAEGSAQRGDQLKAAKAAAAKPERHIAEQRVDDDRDIPGSAGKPKPGPKAPAAPKPAEAEGRPVPGARHSNYAEEAAELLAGLSATRKRRNTSPSGDPDAEDSPDGVTRVLRNGLTEPADD
jgi:hypothetical protein